MSKPTYTIDGAACGDLAATAAEFNRVFAVWWGADYWDGDLDVFNDILDWVEDFQPYALAWANADAARRGLGHAAMAAWLRDQAADDNEARVRLARAERGKGETLFEWLVQIIAGHAQIELRLA